MGPAAARTVIRVLPPTIRIRATLGQEGREQEVGMTREEVVLEIRELEFVLLPLVFLSLIASPARAFPP